MVSGNHLAAVNSNVEAAGKGGWMNITELKGRNRPSMDAKGLTPILNVSDIQQSVEWFEKLGWYKAWDWGDPPTFASVCNGKCEIFICLNGQGGRGSDALPPTFRSFANETADRGAWISIWVEDVDAVYQLCIAQGIEVTWSPADMPWDVREMHIRHPDGHILRISCA
jgi:catechol 2,3-dioxygenase-like lactoylglutathione lyase family enzyme